MCEECRARIVPKCWDEIQAFLAKYPDAEYTYAHIALGDYNLSDGDIHWCLEDEQINEWLLIHLKDCNNYYDVEQLIDLHKATYAFLYHLLNTYTEDERGERG